MNNVLMAAVVALIAGAAGAWLFTQASSETAGSVAGPDDTELLREQVADLRRELEALKNPPATLGADAPAGHGPRAAEREAVVEAVLAEMDARVDARVDERVASKLQELAPEAAASDEPSWRPARRKRMALADAARELELSAAEEDELRRIYEDSMNRFMKLAAGPDGNVDDVKRDLEAARANPATGQALLMKYVPRMMQNLPEVMAISSEREAAVAKAVGPEKARRLNSEFDIVEANPMGRTFRIGASMESVGGAGGR